MFNYFKKLNKKFICSICSACLLCTIGISKLEAAENPLRLGENTVSVAEVGKNVFLTNTLKDNVYSSHLLPIFSEAPLLYVDENGNPSLTISRVLSEGYHQVKYGKENSSVAVYIAAMPYSADSSSSSSLDWYVLDQSSWKNICVKDPGKYVFLYHVKSTDDGINGTIDNTDSLNIKTADTMVNMISDNFLLNSESSDNESNEFEELNPRTQALGFRYSYVDEDESTTKNNTFKISNDTSAFLDFLGNLMNGNYTLLGKIHQYDRKRRIKEDLTIEPTPYAYCMMTRKLAEKINDENMITTLEQAMNLYGISAETPFGRTMFQSNGDPLPELDQNTKLLGFKAGRKWYIITDNNSVHNSKRRQRISLNDFVSEQVSHPNLASTDNVREYMEDGTRIDEDTTLSIPSNLVTCLNLLRKLSINNNDTEMLQNINNLMDQYKITKENPNGLKPSNLA